MRRIKIFFGSCIILAFGVCNAGAEDTIAKQELAPQGSVRAGIAVGETADVFFAMKDRATGQYRGITVELVGALAKTLGVPMEIVPYAKSGENRRGREQRCVGCDSAFARTFEIESTARYLGIEVDDAIEIAEKIDI